MNANENVSTFGRARGRGRSLKVMPIQRTFMGPPKRPAPKKKERSSSMYTSSSSSHILWKAHQDSGSNNITGVQTVTSSRSHSSSETESKVIVALSEGRGEARCEVGIAVISSVRPTLILCQISDTQSYINTLTKINIFNPSEILIPLTFIESSSSNRLLEKIKEQFTDVKITGVSRGTFNKSVGMQYVKSLCVPSLNAILLILEHKYYALAATAALLTYMESTLYVIYANESVKVEYQESEGCTIIDVATADRLELVASARPTMKKRYSCLLDVLNYCHTKVGTLTLRASILQPPCSVPDIEMRLDCITELKEHSEMLTAVQVILQKISNIDQLLSLATILPDQAQNCSERQVNYILVLNSLLEQIVPLRDIFENSKQPFFVELRKTLSNPSFAQIKEIVRTLIHTDAHPAKGKYGIIQRCFAIKSGINSLLDLVRKSYSERLDDMREYVKALGEKYNLALNLNNNQKKGYHIVMTLNAHQKKNFKKNDLPSEFIQVERLSSTYTMNTQNLIDLANRVENINMEILKMSNIMIYKILIEIRKHMGVFYKLCEDIAKLDMFQSLAQASTAMHYTRPKFADYLEIIHARHPLLDFLCSVEPTANSVYASEDYNMNIITGPNGSGKSIFIRQILLIQVMAQVGCYVPAQSATLRVANRILARVYLEDNMACGASAFVLEMKEIEYFLTVLTRNTLIIVDELCRSTSVEEGTALAMALCEKLMTTPAFVFFTTHFKFLTKLRDLYFNVKTWQLETITETIDDQIILHFTYSIIPGVTSLEHYGFFLARGSWLENIIKYAEEVLRKLSTSQKKSSPHLRQVNPAARLKYDLEAEFKMLKAKKQLIQAVINQKLLEYQTNLENLGYHIDFSGPSHVFINENNNGSYYNEDLVQNLNNSDIHLLNQVIADDQNLHCYADDDDNEDNFSHSMNAALVKQQPYNLSVQPMINVDARSKFNESTDNFMKNTSANLSGISENVAYQLQPFNISYDDRQMLVPEDHNNPQHNPCFINFAAENFGTFFNPEKNQPNFNSNSFEYSFKLSQISTDNAEVNSPFDNIFEPEIVLESMDGLEINYYMQKGDSIVRENVTPNSVSKHQNNSTAREYSLEQPEISAASNTELSRRYSIISVEEPSVSQLTLSDSCQNQNSTIFEDALSEICESETNQSTCYIKTSQDFSEHIEYHPKTNLNQDSFLSVNELQFSLPLQQNIEKTSTPIPCNIYLSQSMEINNQRDVHQFRTSSSDDVSADKQPTKSTSTYSSDTIKWSMNVNPIKKDVEQNLNKSDSTNLKVTTGSAIHNLSKASNISKADITAIITDLQSCSEYFSDNEEWDSIDEEIKSKINQSKVSFNDNNNEQHNKNLSKEAKKVNIGNTNVTVDKTKVQLLNPEIKTPMCNTGNSTTILQNYRNSCPKSQTQNKINILQNICLVSKADPNKGLKSCHTQIDPRLIKYSTNIFQQCVGTLNQTTQQNDQFCNKTTCQTNEGCHINYSGSCNVLQNNNNTTLSDYVQDINAPQLEQQEKNISLTQQQKEFKESQLHHPNYNEETTEMSICKAVQECNITSQSYIEKHDEIDPPIVLELSSNKFHLAANDVQTTQSKEKTVQLFCKNNQQLLNEKVNDQSQQYKCETPKPFETSDDVTKLERTFIKDRTHPVTSSDIMENKIFQSEAEEGQKSLKESISDTNHQESARLTTKMAAFVSDVTQSDAKNFMLHSESKEELQVVEVPLNTSLEPLGDIHLELFSDESILNESINSLNTKSKYLLGAEIETGNERIETTNKNTQQSELDMQTNNININQEDEHEIPSSSEYFLPMQYSNKKNVNKSDINESSEQKSKRKRLGYVTQIQQADNSQLLLHSASPPTSEQLEKDQAIGTQSKFCKNSSDISDNQPDKIKDNNTTEELFCTPSSFASGSSTSKKSKWKPPFKTTSNRNDSSHGQSIKKKPKMLKFKDPKKLTKKEIELDFYEQDKRILENGSLTEYLEQQINRPSVKQLQQAKHIALFQKTETGVVVVPAKERKTKIKKRKFTVPLKVQPQNFDVSLFSDQNSDKFEKFMNFNSENKVPVRQEISAFQRISSDVAKKREDDQKTIANSQETTFSNFGKNIQDFKCELLQKLRTPISPDIFKKVSQNSESDNNSKSGYYTQNKDCIDNIIGKYLNTTSIFEDETIDSQNNCTEVQNSGSSVFSKQTLLLEDD